MKISDVQKRLEAPFPAHVIEWKPGVMTKDRKRALMLAYVDARAVMARLDAICPDAWAFDWEPVHGAPVPTAKGSLTVLGVTRCDVGVGKRGQRLQRAAEGRGQRRAETVRRAVRDRALPVRSAFGLG